MFTTITTSARFVLVIGALAIATLLAACGTGIGAPAPSAVPTPVQPAPDPTPARSHDPGTDPQPIRVGLRSTSGQDVFVEILDRSGTIERAVSGRPAEGVSVGTGTLQVENLDPRTLRLSWSDFPIDNSLSLYVEPAGVGYRLVLIQPAPTGPADAMAEDRILELTFDHEISAAKVEAFLQEGLDTSG